MRIISLVVTQSCNMDCRFCFLRSEQKNLSISLSLFKNIISQAKNCGFELIHLTGGEPILHPNFNQLIDQIIEHKLNFGLSSNGYYYKKYDFLTQSNNFKYITFSLDSHRSEIHDKLRIKGSFKRIVNAIDLFVQEGIDVKVSICLNKYNYKEIEEYVYFINKLNVKDIRFLSVIPTGNNQEFLLTDIQKKQCCDTINSLRNKVAINLRIMSSLHTAEGVKFCSALDLSGMAVDSEGNLRFCCDCNTKGSILGSLKNKKLPFLMKKGCRIVDYLTEKRKEYLYTNTLFDGFNSCIFCNTILKKKIKY